MNPKTPRIRRQFNSFRKEWATSGGQRTTKYKQLEQDISAYPTPLTEEELQLRVDIRFQARLECLQTVSMSNEDREYLNSPM